MESLLLKFWHSTLAQPFKSQESKASWNVGNKLLIDSAKFQKFEDLIFILNLILLIPFSLKIL
jgi:hypothetical protein